MATKNNPGAWRCHESALPDEPIFTLLGRDPAAPATLRFWAEERQRVGKTKNPDDLDRIIDARLDAHEMEVWREENRDPNGDGNSTWRFAKITDDDGGPVRIKPENVQYIPAGREQSDTVVLNTEWLQARTRELTEGQISREDFAELIALACEAPVRRVETEGEKVVIDTDPNDLAHAPEVPPHRFSVFYKGDRYAYARGLEINPSHLPTALDAMAKDGWYLCAIFGKTDSQNVGFIFERRAKQAHDTR